MDEYTPNENDDHAMHTIATALRKQRCGLIRAKRKSDGRIVTLIAVSMGNDLTRLVPLAEILDNETVMNYMPAVEDKVTGESKFEPPQEHYGRINADTLEIRDMGPVYRN